MRPKDLKFPFTWEERHPALFRGVFVVPQHYEKHNEWKGDLFAFDRPVSIEYCSGNGDWIIARAKSTPNQLWIAVEKQFERVRKIWSKMQNEGVKNLLIICGEAQTFTRHYLPEQSINEIYINFPDPWPKPRHAKWRLIQSPFADELARIVKKGGHAIFVTDDAPYCQQMIGVMHAHPNWKSCFANPFFKNSWDGYGTSWFENLWRSKDRSIHYLQFEKK